MPTEHAADLELAVGRYLEEPLPERLEAVVAAGTGLVRRFGNLYAPGNEDVLQVGYEGLLKALERFEPQRGNRFTTYASHIIIGEMRHFFRREAAYYCPGSISDLRSRVDALIEDTLKATGEVPTVHEMAEALGVRPEGVVQAMRAGLVPLDDLELGAIQATGHRSFRLPIEDRIVLEQALSKLGRMQRQVIDALFFRGLTQSETAASLGTNQRQVSRVLHRSLKDLAGQLEDDQA